MSLWVKRAGHLMMAGAVFFWSCEEDIALLGYKADERFGVHYWEIPLESSLLLIDSIRTSNLAQETHRLMMGRYSDDQLGVVTTGAYTQYYRNGTVPDSLALSTFDSISLHLAYDLYYYGFHDVTSQEIAVYELEEELDNVLATNPLYYNNSVKQLGAQVGTKTFAVDPVIFDDIIENEIDTTLTLSIPLDPAFGQRIFDSAVNADGATTEEDSTYLKLDKFVKEFKGISIQSVQGDKVFGIDPRNSESKIVVHFHLNNKRDSLVLSFGNLSGFSTIASDKTGSDVEGLENYYEDFDPVSGNRYLQNGVGIVTRVDLTNFLTYASSDTIPAMIINSAELFIDGVSATAKGQPLPTATILRVLGDDNTFRSVETLEDTTTVTSYNQTLSSSFAVLDDFQRGDQFILSYDEEKHTYNGFMTLFLQELYKKRNTGPLLTSLAIFPVTPAIGKTVNRSNFHKDNIKLRVYFTVPTNNTIE
jgi:hypothetical protein